MKNNLQDIEGITSRREAAFDIDVYFIGIEIVKILKTKSKKMIFLLRIHFYQVHKLMLLEK
jgi:hypothetical protein